LTSSYHLFFQSYVVAQVPANQQHRHSPSDQQGHWPDSRQESCCSRQEVDSCKEQGSATAGTPTISDLN